LNFHFIDFKKQYSPSVPMCK